MSSLPDVLSQTMSACQDYAYNHVLRCNYCLKYLISVKLGRYLTLSSDFNLPDFEWQSSRHSFLHPVLLTINRYLNT